MTDEQIKRERMRVAGTLREAAAWLENRGPNSYDIGEAKYLTERATAAIERLKKEAE